MEAVIGALTGVDMKGILNLVIPLSSFGRSHNVAWSAVHRFRLKRLASGTLYLRINEGGLLIGRYWIPVHKFPERKALSQALIDHQR